MFLRLSRKYSEGSWRNKKKIFKSSRKISLPKKCRERSRSKPFALMKQETSWESLKMPPLRNHHRRDPLSNECRLFFISLMSFFKKVRNMKGVDCNWHCHMSKKMLILRPFTLLLLCYVLMSILSIRKCKEWCKRESRARTM